MGSLNREKDLYQDTATKGLMLFVRLHPGIMPNIMDFP